MCHIARRTDDATFFTPLTTAHRYLLVLGNGGLADPAAFVTASREWRAGDPFTGSDGSRSRIVAARTSPVAAIGFDALWRVEPLD